MSFLLKKAISNKYQNFIFENKTRRNHSCNSRDLDVSIDISAEIMNLTGNEFKYVMGLSKLSLQ